ncbi:hypothetical protein SNE40_013463 [Patella caerulea]|uniref:Uncharacterized protein n=1 Tax=Patella caerulea TaxID=87958 RepID=A0AAN8JBN4_PATCE
MGLPSQTQHHITTTFTWPDTNDLSRLPGMSHTKYTEGQSEDFVMSWSQETNVLLLGVIDFLPRTAVDTSTAGSPTGILALSSHQKKIPSLPISIAFCFKYFSCAAQKC